MTKKNRDRRKRRRKINRIEKVISSLPWLSTTLSRPVQNMINWVEWYKEAMSRYLGIPVEKMHGTINGTEISLQFPVQIKRTEFTGILITPPQT